MDRCQIHLKGAARMDPVVVEGVFQRNNTPYFMGGSRRFGYACNDSDTDYFTFTNDVDVLGSILSELKRLGFRVWNKPYGQGRKTIWCLDEEFHVIIHFERGDFLERQNNHLLVEGFLKRHPEWVGFVKRMKEGGRSGSDVFLRLLSQAKGFTAVGDNY